MSMELSTVNPTKCDIQHPFKVKVIVYIHHATESCDEVTVVIPLGETFQDKHFPQVWLGNDSEMVEERGAASIERNYINSRKSSDTFQCPHCPYVCSTRSHFTKHYRTHTGEKPFSCPYCSYQASDKSNLTKHVRIHTGEKPFSCPHCPFKSNRNDRLLHHMRTHL